MNLSLLSDIKKAYTNLNPNGVRALAEKPVSIGVLASSDAVFESIRYYFRGPNAVVERITESAPAQSFSLLVAESNYPRPKNAFEFHALDPRQTVDKILDERQDIEIALARNFDVFRPCVVDRIIHRTSQENALFSIVTALPNVIPSFIELPWAIGEFASDTAFLTMNQVRMAFLIAACHDKPIGYVEQKLELATIVTGAFGWRAIARELAGKIPLGGGLVPKAAISYAGSYVVGKGLDRLHRTGATLNRQERKALYSSAIDTGRRVVDHLITTVKNRNAA